MGKVTISTHNGSAVAREHNIRNEKVCSKEEHIDLSKVHEIWYDKPIREFYKETFGEALKEYNDKQNREDRKIKDYYTHVKNDKKKHTCYEMIIGVYNQDEIEACSEEMGKEIMREFVDNWEVRNPNLHLIGAYYHADEEGQPHVHIDYVPVAAGYTKGMSKQNGLVKALEQMGFEKKSKDTAQIQWQRRENEYLENLCKARGLEVYHPKEENRSHLETETFKAIKAIHTASSHIAKLEAERDKAEQQAEKALQRKVKAFSKSYKKDKELGWSYDRGLEKEIKTIAEEIAEDVKAISHTDLDIDYEYQIASRLRQEAEEESKKIICQKNAELKKAIEYRDNQLEIIQKEAQIRAENVFKSFINENFVESNINTRLKDFCREIKFNNGESVYDRFLQAEEERKQKLSRSWYSR